jgi:hypothetical protein
MKNAAISELSLTRHSLSTLYILAEGLCHAD